MKPTATTPLLSAQLDSKQPRSQGGWGLDFPELPATHFHSNLNTTRTVEAPQPSPQPDEALLTSGAFGDKALMSTAFFPNLEDAHANSGTKSTLDPSANHKNLSNQDANFTLSSTPLSKRYPTLNALGKNKSTKHSDDPQPLEPSHFPPKPRNKILINLQTFEQMTGKPGELEASSFTALAANYASNSTNHYKTLTNYNSQGSAANHMAHDNLSGGPALYDPSKPRKSFEASKSVRNIGVLASRYSSNVPDPNAAPKSIENLEQSAVAFTPGRDRLPKSTQHNRESQSESKKQAKLPRTNSKVQILSQIRSTLNELEEMCVTKPEGSKRMDSKSARSIRNVSICKSEAVSNAFEVKSMRSVVGDRKSKKNLRPLTNTSTGKGNQNLSQLQQALRLGDSMIASPINSPADDKFDFGVQVEEASALNRTQTPLVQTAVSPDIGLNRTSILGRKIVSATTIPNKPVSVNPSKPCPKSIRTSIQLIDKINAKYRRSKQTHDNTLNETLYQSNFPGTRSEMDFMTETPSTVYNPTQTLAKKASGLLQLSQSRTFSRLEQPRPHTANAFSRLQEPVFRNTLHKDLQQITDLENHHFFKTTAQTPKQPEAEPTPENSGAKSVSRLNVYSKGWGKILSSKSNVYSRRPESSQEATLDSPFRVPRDSKTPSLHPYEKRLVPGVIIEERDSEQASFRRIPRHSLDNKIQIMERILLIFDQESKRSDQKLRQARADYEAKLEILIALKAKIEALGSAPSDKKALRSDLESFYSRMKLRLNDYLNYLSLQTNQQKRAEKLMIELRLRLLNVRTSEDSQGELEECTRLCDKIKPLVGFTAFQGQIDLEYQLQKVSEEISCRPEFVPDASGDSRFFSVHNPNLSMMSMQKGNVSKFSAYTTEISSVMKMVDAIRDRHHLEERKSHRVPKASERVIGEVDQGLGATEFKGKKPVFRKLKFQSDPHQEVEAPMTGKKQPRTKFFRPISSQHQ